MLFFDTWKEARRLVKERRLVDAAAKEKADIAAAFNNLYTYRERWDTSESTDFRNRLPGTAMFGINPPKGYAWMCPQCNKIHLATSSSVLTGLQYPKCCSFREGDRLYHNIRLPK